MVRPYKNKYNVVCHENQFTEGKRIQNRKDAFVSDNDSDLSVHEPQTCKPLEKEHDEKRHDFVGHTIVLF